MKINTNIYLLTLLMVCPLSYAGNISPKANGGALPVGPSGQIFTYFPSTIMGKNGQMTAEDPAKTGDWSVTGKPFTGTASRTGESYEVKTDVKKLNPDSIEANRGTVTCKTDSSQIQGMAVDE